MAREPKLTCSFHPQERTAIQLTSEDGHPLFSRGGGTSRAYSRASNE
jgi:hypothetical protein